MTDDKIILGILAVVVGFVGYVPCTKGANALGYNYLIPTLSYQ